MATSALEPGQHEALAVQHRQQHPEDHLLEGRARHCHGRPFALATGVGNRKGDGAGKRPRKAAPAPLHAVSWLSITQRGGGGGAPAIWAVEAFHVGRLPPVATPETLTDCRTPSGWQCPKLAPTSETMWGRGVWPEQVLGCRVLKEAPS